MLSRQDFQCVYNKNNLEFVIDRRSYTHNLSSCEIKAWKKFRPERCWSTSTSVDLSHSLGSLSNDDDNAKDDA